MHVCISGGGMSNGGDGGTEIVMSRFAMQDWMLVQNSTMNSRTTNFFLWLSFACLFLSVYLQFFWSCLSTCVLVVMGFLWDLETIN